MLRANECVMRSIYRVYIYTYIYYICGLVDWFGDHRAAIPIWPDQQTHSQKQQKIPTHHTTGRTERENALHTFLRGLSHVRGHMYNDMWWNNRGEMQKVARGYIVYRSSVMRTPTRITYTANKKRERNKLRSA